ncbi:MAG: YafY family transcriptional regulator [Lachnospiraceae bacterium]|jgi:predicted DNA-binding transcriptional regulator YafY|nr:YafY family transcriptional regulator [Lachnospiraceae bacterium]
MRESRLFQILYHLLQHGQATAPKLAEKLEVSVRTIYRDIDALSSAGIPVFTEAGRNGGIHIMEDFVLDRALLSRQEKQEILSALQSLAAVGHDFELGILEKLSGLFQVSSENWFEVDFSRWWEPKRQNNTFSLLKSAILQCKCVKIHYANSCGVLSERIVQPLKLAYKGSAWYLKAYCTMQEGYRIFKLNRILELEPLEEHFEPRSFPEAEESSDAVCTQIVLRFPKELAYRVYDEFDRNYVTQEENGKLLVSAYMPADPWLVSFLLSFGPQVDVIAPAYLKEILAKQGKLIYEKFKA